MEKVLENFENMKLSEKDEVKSCLQDFDLLTTVGKINFKVRNWVIWMSEVSLKER